jgi:outer membrane protein assembly factor BamB
MGNLGSLRRNPSGLLLLGLACCLATCGKDENPAQVEANSQSEQAANGAEQSAQQKMLAALGYLDYVEETAGRPSGATTYDAAQLAPGLNLVSVHRRVHTLLFDADGSILHSWQGKGDVWGHAELLPNGDILVPEKTGKRFDLLRLDWDGNEVWRVELGTHHDVEVRPDGLISSLGFQERQEDVIDPKIPFRDECILLIDPETGQELERASFFDLFENADDFEYLEQRWVERVRRNTDWIDLFHANSVEWMHRPELAERSPIYASDHVLVSFRHQACVAIFDWTQRKMVWQWGRGEISGSHDASVLANGNILIFDNGLGRGWSRAVEVNPLTKEIVWEYRADSPEDFFTQSRGSAQRLANGNTLLGESDRGHAIEVNPAGEIVWEYWHPGRDDKIATITRIKRVDAPARLVKQGPAQANGD